jgi:hypothetical protein
MSRGPGVRFVAMESLPDPGSRFVVVGIVPARRDDRV